MAPRTHSELGYTHSPMLLLVLALLLATPGYTLSLVLRGEWGAGQSRIQRLEDYAPICEAGYDITGRPIYQNPSIVLRLMSFNCQYNSVIAPSPHTFDPQPNFSHTVL
jgi:hypothetical protein